MQSQSKAINTATGPRISDLRYNIQIKTTTTSTSNGLGHPASASTTSATVPAAARQRDLPEMDNMGKQTYVSYVFFTIHARAVNVRQTVVFEGQTYDIIGVDSIKYAPMWTEIKCKLVQ